MYGLYGEVLNNWNIISEEMSEIFFKEWFEKKSVLKRMSSEDMSLKERQSL